MAYNGVVLARAREHLAELRENNAAEAARRTERVYELIPRVRAIDSALRRQMAELCTLAFSREDGAAEKIADLKEANLRLQAERAGLLARAGLPENLTRELSGLLRDDGERFDAFRLDYYGTETDPALGVSPREAMRLVYDTCRTYAAGFSRSSPSLIFRGGPGLGKTFLSACVAREVAARGFSVAYESAPRALGEFETQRFSRDAAEADAAAAKVREYLSCDLMILDDLGTEMTTSFTVSALYQLVNTRLTESRQTIISTNMGEGEVERRYGGQIASRLAGEFETLIFAGSDIRRLKKEGLV